MKYNIADLIVEFEPKYNALKARSKKYKCLNDRDRDFKISVNDESIEKEKELDKNLTTELAEYVIVGTTFYKALLRYNGFLLHSSAVVIDNEAYLFSADCGVGKSTHTSLWLKYLKDKSPYILNDDKPAIRIMKDGIYAYGTPFSGKHDINENKKAKLKGICFIEQAKENFIERLEPKEAVKLIFGQTVRKITEEEMNKLFDAMEVIIEKIPIYKLHCDMSKEAVNLSYKTMKGGIVNEN